MADAANRYLPNGVSPSDVAVHFGGIDAVDVGRSLKDGYGMVIESLKGTDYAVFSKGSFDFEKHADGDMTPSDPSAYFMTVSIWNAANGGGNSGGGRRPGFNIDNAVSTLNENALSSSSGYCAKYVRYALEAGGINMNGHPSSAKDYDSFLSKKGFNEVTSNNYKPIKGDIAVMESFTGVKSHPYGHIQMYNGTQWISDFRQNSFWPGSDYRNFTPDLTIFRW